MKVDKTTVEQKREEDYEDWEYSPNGISYMFAGVHGIDPEYEGVFSIALHELPRKIVDFAKKNIYFDSTRSKDNASYYDSKSFKKYRGIVRIELSVWKKSPKKIEEIIAHEIAHAYLRHEFGLQHSKEDELEADRLASKWLGRKIDFYEKIFQEDENLLKKLDRLKPK